MLLAIKYYLEYETWVGLRTRILTLSTRHQFQYKDDPMIGPFLSNQVPYSSYKDHLHLFYKRLALFPSLLKGKK
jgi:hypothetical protein